MKGDMPLPEVESGGGIFRAPCGVHIGAALRIQCMGEIRTAEQEGKRVELFYGSAVALVTPFSGGQVDFKALEALIDWQIREGTDALVVLGTTGEPSTLSDGERRDVIACASGAIGGRRPMIVGAGANDTKKAVALAAEAESLGADGLLVVTPYYNRASDEGLARHFLEVADAVCVPVILYNVPGRTGVNLRPEIAARLAAHPRLCGVKEASGDLAQLSHLAELAGEGMSIYAGNDGEVLPVLALGGSGVISVAANIVPAAMHALTQDWLAGNVRSCRRRQLELLELVRALFCEVSPIPVKAALSIMGKIENELRLPLCPLDAERTARLRRAMERFGLVGAAREGN